MSLHPTPDRIITHDHLKALVAQDEQDECTRYIPLSLNEHEPHGVARFCLMNEVIDLQLIDPHNKSVIAQVQVLPPDDVTDMELWHTANVIMLDLLHRKHWIID